MTFCNNPSSLWQVSQFLNIPKSVKISKSDIHALNSLDLRIERVEHNAAELFHTYSINEKD